MQLTAAPARGVPIVYPQSDGKPMADNTKQFRWIFVLAGNLAALFREAADVFVSGNQFWYPVEGEMEVKQAPDVYVVFGRPKGDRSSYRQWEEGNVPMTVVFEVLSPENTYQEMIDKFAFYEEHGVEEYYVYDPDSNRLQAYVRKGDVLIRVRNLVNFTSPRLGIRFDLSGPEMVVYYPDGEPFLTFEQLRAEYERERRERLAAELRAARLAELSRKALRQQATPEELQELEGLLG
jgi:Uma2 family endonuclease